MRCLLRHDWRPRVLAHHGRRRKDGTFIKQGSAVTFVCERCGKVKVKRFDGILTKETVRGTRP